MELQDIDSFLKWMQWADEKSGGWVSISFIVGFFMLTYTIGLRFGKERALIISGFSTTLMSFLLIEGGFLDWSWFIVSGVLLLIGIVASAFKQ